MTPQERLAAEEFPTGTFGHARSARQPARPGPTWTAEEQAQHVADMLADLNRRASKRRTHLRVIEGEAA
ncbi:hypothetical protein V2W30_22515 [Streptomyces sp. Q6]|uniref:Uncharacterized protein n=1 Tax=Streptomyces citrinus TaxID=3118173 RepID=A0ACD5AF13_9ACTN